MRDRWAIVCLFLACLPWCAQALDNTVQHPAGEQEYWAQYEKKNWEQAIAAAEKLVEASRAQSNQAPLKLAEDLSLLGDAQLASHNYIAAEAAYSEALQIAEPRVAPASDKLLPALRGMGYTLAANGKHDLAVPYLERALLVSRRTHGLFNFNQQGLLRQLATSSMKLGNFPEAEQQMQYLYRVGEHTYGKNDPRMAVVINLIGDFYVNAGLVAAGRDLYRESLAIVEKKLGRNDLATVNPLRAYADSYRRELFLSNLGVRPSVDKPTSEAPPDGKPMSPRYLNVEGERALKRALKALDENPKRSTLVLFDTLLDLGDWYMIKSEPDDAMPYYRRAYALLDQMEPQHRAAARESLSFPAQVYYAMPLLATRNLNRPDEEVDERFVQVAFTVAADGSVRDESVVEENASSRHVAETLAAIRTARYRPKFVNGDPVDSLEVSYRQVFRQRKERDTE